MSSKFLYCNESKSSKSQSKFSGFRPCDPTCSTNSPDLSSGVENALCHQNNHLLTEIRDNIKSVLKDMKYESPRQEFKPMGPKFSEYDRFISGISIEGYKFKKPFDKKKYDEFVEKKIREVEKEVERSFWEKHADELMSMLLDENEMEEYLEGKKRKALRKEKILRDEEEWNAEMKKLETDFKKILEDDMNELDKRLETDKIFNYLKGKVELENLMMKKLDETIYATIKDLVFSFSAILEKENELFAEHFQFFYNFEQTRIHGIRTVESLVSETMLDKLKKDDEGNKFNVMYAFGEKTCSCHSSRHFRSKLNELKTLLKNTGKKLEESSKRDEESTENIENRLYTIIKHFQKFKSFVVGAVPHFSDYFENVEKLMFFELTQIVIKRRPELFKDDQLVIVKSVPCAHKKSDVPLVIELQESHDRRVHGKDSTSMYSTPYSSGLMFSKNLCVREDFRDMIRKGLEKSDINDLYIFHFDGKHKVKDVCDKSESCSEILKVHDLEEITSEMKSKASSYKNDKISVATVKSSKFKRPVTVLKSWEVARVPCDVSEASTADIIPTKSRLLDVKDSLIIARKKSDTKDVLPARRKSFASEVKDSVMIAKRKGQNDSIRSSVDIELHKKSSLRLATDSLTLLRKHISYVPLKTRQSKMNPTTSALIHHRISLARDSIEVLKKIKSKTSRLELDKSHVSKDEQQSERTEEKIYHDVFDSLSLYSNTSTLVLLDFLTKLKSIRRSSQKHDKSVGISHFEIFSLSGLDSTINLVNFESKQTIILFESLSDILEEQESQTASLRDNFLTKKNELKVVGDVEMKEHQMSKKQFLLTEMRRFSRLVTKYPFLRKYFTPEDTICQGENYCEDKKF